MRRPVRTRLTPPRLASLPQERGQLANSSRATVFAHDGTRLLRAWGPPERPFVVGVEPDGERWTVLAWGCGAARARVAVREMFSLDDPLEEFYRRTRTEPVLQGSERRFRGLRPPRDASVFEALVHAIVGQQLSVASANAVKRRLLERLGRVREVEGVEVPLFPPPSAVRAAGADVLRGAGLSRAKAGALRTVAAWSAGAPSATSLRLAPLTTARAELERLGGVGRWTAENALLRGAGRRDVFVAGDLGVRVALDRFGAVPRTATEDDARAWAERCYPGWGSYATLYLWRRLVAERDRAGDG